MRLTMTQKCAYSIFTASPKAVLLRRPVGFLPWAGGAKQESQMDETYLDEVIRLMETGQYGYSDACDAAWPSLKLQAEIEAIERQRRNTAA